MYLKPGQVVFNHVLGRIPFMENEERDLIVNSLAILNSGKKNIFLNPDNLRLPSNTFFVNSVALHASAACLQAGYHPGDVAAVFLSVCVIKETPKEFAFLRISADWVPLMEDVLVAGTRDFENVVIAHQNTGLVKAGISEALGGSNNASLKVFTKKAELQNFWSKQNLSHDSTPRTSVDIPAVGQASAQTPPPTVYLVKGFKIKHASNMNDIDE